VIILIGSTPTKYIKYYCYLRLGPILIIYLILGYMILLGRIDTIDYDLNMSLKFVFYLYENTHHSESTKMPKRYLTL